MKKYKDIRVRNKYTTKMFTREGVTADIQRLAYNIAVAMQVETVVETSPAGMDAWGEHSRFFPDKTYTDPEHSEPTRWVTIWMKHYEKGTI